MKKQLTLLSLTFFSLALNGCYMHQHNPHVDQVYQAKRAEAVYAHKLEQRYHQLLSHLVPGDALRVSVSVELDFSQSTHIEVRSPDEIGLLAESETTKRHEKGKGEEFIEQTQSRKYLGGTTPA